ncbi:MAG TPA: alpha/beta fold hydrolase [Candidatus Limnocylindrales bacterium]|nr:alpha/beta fold hydrolase [Candidatus Limnocylindrales bacterium]
MTATTDRLPLPITATALDLPIAVAEALAAPPPGERIVVEAAGIPFAVTTWGDAAHPPLLLVHGVTSSAVIWWRTGPALAAAGRRVYAPDLPGHGRTGAWAGRHRFAETAADVAALVVALGIDVPELAVIGHSWGATIVAHLPAAGVRPRVLIQLDTPVLPLARMADMTVDPVERRYDDLDEAIRVIGSTYPSWSYGDVVAKATSLTQVDEAAARAVLLDNGDWDGGLAALAGDPARDLDRWLVRGEAATGSFVPDEAVPAFAAVIGSDHVLTVAGGPHSPQRTHPEATLVAFLRALDGSVSAPRP